jgi:hypothetical protein
MNDAKRMQISKIFDMLKSHRMIWFWSAINY